MYFLSKYNDELFQKLSANFSKPIHDIINYSTFICPFEFGKCGKVWKKLQKFEILRVFLWISCMHSLMSQQKNA